MSVSAIRNFDPGTLAGDGESEATQFVILDRQFAQVENGTWQTALNLWQVAPDGRYRENWQLDRPIPPAGASPSSTITFLVALEPSAFSRSVDRRAVATLDEPGNTLLSFTSSGEPYLQVSQAIAVALPTGQAQVGQLTLEPPKDPWAGRSNLNAAADFDQPPTLPFEEKDNLPLPQSNMLN
ncbi:hypothetical protein [Pseudanabaena sp. FACHB-2040]|uniref:hypothetical protein n=1 Tax=Pseudanabaena sp. FACHB-2040 TaxID=2692859 RepID=UPI001683493E|nr:hypothetical protein [Pseudanabaena sp. FACHB-2040]